MFKDKSFKCVLCEKLKSANVGVFASEMTKTPGHPDINTLNTLLFCLMILFNDQSTRSFQHRVCLFWESRWGCAFASRETAERRWWRAPGMVKPTSLTTIAPSCGSSSTRTSTPSVRVRDPTLEPKLSKISGHTFSRMVDSKPVLRCGWYFYSQWQNGFACICTNHVSLGSHVTIYPANTHGLIEISK